MERAVALEARMTAVRKGNHDIDIVQAVQASRVLYDKSHEHHKNPRVKEVEWQRIGEEIGVPATAVIKRWTVIRERFASEKRKVVQLGPSSWWLMQHMDWLNVHIQPRQRGKYLQNEMSPSSLPNLPNLTHISNLPNLPNLTCISNFNNSNNGQQRRFSNGHNTNGNMRYVDVGEPDEDDSRSASPIMSIAYPEVCMKDISSEDENGSYTSTKDENGSYMSLKEENGSYKSSRDDNGSYISVDNKANIRNSTGGEMRMRRATNGSEDSSHGPLALGLDLDEAAAARVMAALKGIDDPVLRHRFRQRAHHLAEECELAALQTHHQDKKMKTEI